MVHENAQVPIIFKFHYLKSCVTGEAAEVISSLESSTDNYEIAWNLLTERYDNRRFIAESHVKALFDIPSVTKEFSIQSLIDKIHKHARALRALNQPVDHWDLLLIHIIKNKLTNYIKERWDDSVGTTQIPNLSDMITFLTHRARIDSTRQSQSNTNVHKNSKSNYRTHNSPATSAFSATTSTNVQTPRLCPIYKGNHTIYVCDKFLKLDPHQRYITAKNTQLCVICLRGNHQPNECRLKGGCRLCHKQHNTLLHFEQSKSLILSKNQTRSLTNSQTETSSMSPSAQPTSGPGTSTSNYHLRVCSEVYLATAVVDGHGNYQPCRVMFDGGAQSCAITKKCLSRLSLRTVPFHIPLLTFNQMKTDIKSATATIIKSRFDNRTHKLDLLVIDEISESMPTMSIDKDSLEIPSHIFLADPKFYKPAPIDILLSAEYAYSFLCSEKIHIKGHAAVLQKSVLGWIIAGRIYNSKRSISKPLKIFNLMSRDKFNQLSILWELEHVPTASKQSREEQACALHYINNVRREDNDRYIVKLPFNDKINALGNSKYVALQRLQSLERKLAKNPELKAQYVDCINSYIREGHMTLADERTLDTGYYLPHHAVIKKTSITTKTRVVFDASARSSSGVSLNDCLIVGPTIQDDLFSIFTRFRSFLFALTADIEQMYRQIKVCSNDIIYQKILWRDNPSEPVKTYNLNRVTFGTAAAPYLAIRTLHQLARDEYNSHPIASTILSRDFYVDDLLTGAQSLPEALNLRNELIKLLSKGGFNLRKWGSNDPQLINNFPENSQKEHMSLDPTGIIKTLGLYWDSSSDSIIYTITLPRFDENITKRSILSQTAKLFDPLGLISPVVVSAKLLIQSLWKLKSDWDDPVPTDIQNAWTEYRSQLHFLNNLRLARCIVIPNAVNIQIHGFSDASEKAYGACIYLRSMNDQGEVKCALVSAKSRVAPLKSITLPKLELCAAVALSRLYRSTVQSLQMKIDKTYLWSDSTITLNWIQMEPYTLETFVANRVSEIGSITDPLNWFHVSSNDNPADLISRGLCPKDFLQAKIWKEGPAWLSQNVDMWPESQIKRIDVPGKKKVKPTQIFQLTSNNKNHFSKFIERYSNLRTLKHVMAYCLRFIQNLKQKEKAKRQHGPLLNVEIDNALKIILKVVHTEVFPKEMNNLLHHEPIDQKSSLLCLNPFLDAGIIRVGGRLRNADIPFYQKHPIVLPRNHHITILIIRDTHKNLKHAGPQATLYGVREFFWPIDGRNITRKLIRQCVTCFRAKPRGIDYIMGNLPEKRLSYSRPFLHVGVDFCGPFYVKEKRHRNLKREKAYICIFVCFATKATHLELVGDLTTEAFLGSLKRFFSRRGKAATMHSDNGKNFVGADKELQKINTFVQSTQINSEVQTFLSDQKIKWHFIPPHSPHFGGLWEASVKSFKHHLIRTVGNTLLTYEQLQTYMIEIEAILNSRPLTPMSSDPNDFLPLTPGHFLIGASLTSFPQADYRELRANQLSSWQHAQQMRNHFWARWHREYLNEMITRSKWKSDVRQDNIAVDTLVVEKADNLPPMCWKLARVSEIHPGEDGIVRVVTLKNTTGTYKRSIKKLYPLPIYHQSDVYK